MHLFLMQRTSALAGVGYRIQTLLLRKFRTCIFPLKTANSLDFLVYAYVEMFYIQQCKFTNEITDLCIFHMYVCIQPSVCQIYVFEFFYYRCQRIIGIYITFCPNIHELNFCRYLFLAQQLCIHCILILMFDLSTNPYKKSIIPTNLSFLLDFMNYKKLTQEDLKLLLNTVTTI